MRISIDWPPKTKTVEEGEASAMSLDEETLEMAARDGEMDYNKWPPIVEPLLDRLTHIVYNDFPIPQPYTNINRPPDPPSPSEDRPEPTDSAQPASTTNATTHSPATPIRSLPPVPLFPNSSATTTSHIPDSLPPSQSPQASQNILDTLPAPLLQLLQSIISTLRLTFTSKPPHTFQRLAELILFPQKHYKTLPAWLRAVDRVVNVSSPANIFPLSETPPQLANGVNGDASGGILWKNDSNATNNGYDRDSLGSDESLGGALLTPIPWLRNANHVTESGENEESRRDAEDDGLGQPLELPPTNGGTGSGSEDRYGDANVGAAMAVTGHGDPLVPEREDGAVTQGELIRMEQEAGVVPVAVSRPGVMIGVDPDGNEIEESEEQVPHARGPDVVGAIDMGKVDGKDVQVRIGSPPPEEGRQQTGPNDAQKVLSGSGRGGAMEMVEGFEIVRKEDGEDDMQVDEKGGQMMEEQGKDEDIVLVDADGKLEDEDEKQIPK